MKKLILIFFYSTLLFGQSNVSFYHKNISSEKLNSIRLTNLNDILNFNYQISNFTINGNNNFFYINNLSLEHNPQIMIDDFTIENDLFGSYNLNMLPLSVEQIDSLKIYKSHGIVNGSFNKSGIVKFITKVPLKKLNLSASINLGNEIGDPGPFVYLSDKNENIDKLPMNFGFNFSYRGESGFIVGTVKSTEGFATDKFIKRRIQKNSNSLRKFLTYGGSVKLRYNKIGRFQEFLIGYTEDENYFFLKPFSSEIPSRKQFKFFGLNGIFDITNSINLKYTASSSERDLYEWNSLDYQDFSWHLENSKFKISSNYTDEKLNLTFGLAYEEESASSNIEIDNDQYIQKKLFTDITYKQSSKLTQRFGAEINKVDSDYSFGISQNSIYELNNYSTFNINVSFSRLLFNETHSFWKWRTGYFTVLDRNVFLYSMIPVEKYKKAAIALGYNLSKGKTSLTTEVTYSHFFDYEVSTQSVEFNKDRIKASNSFEGNQFLKNFIIDINFERPIFRNLDFSLNYKFQTVLEATDTFEKKWQIFTQHQFEADFNYQFTETFLVWFQLQYFSESKWDDYHYIKWQSDSFYDCKLEDRFLLNLSLSRWFINRRLLLNTTFRNLLNEPVKLHPLGAQNNLSFYIQVKLYLNSVFN